MKNVVAVIFMLLFQVANANAEEHPNNSIYQIQSKWVTQDNQTVNLDFLKGNHVIMSMVYLSCSYSCPVTIGQMKRVEQALTPEQKAKVHFVLVSFDPKRDTPEKMNKYLVDKKLDPKNWHLITTKSESDLRELAAALEFKYKKSSKGEFEHSMMLISLDEAGVVKKRVEGASQNPVDLVQGL